MVWNVSKMCRVLQVGWDECFRCSAWKRLRRLTRGSAPWTKSSRECVSSKCTAGKNHLPKWLKCAAGIWIESRESFIWSCFRLFSINGKGKRWTSSAGRPISGHSIRRSSSLPPSSSFFSPSSSLFCLEILSRPARYFDISFLAIDNQLPFFQQVFLTVALFNNTRFAFKHMMERALAIKTARNTINFSFQAYYDPIFPRGNHFIGWGARFHQTNWSKLCFWWLLFIFLLIKRQLLSE